MLFELSPEPWHQRELPETNDQNPANDPALAQILDLLRQQTANLAQQQQFQQQHQPS